MFIDTISDDGMNCTLSMHGVRNVTLQFDHIHNNKIYRFANYAKELLKGQSRIDQNGRVDRTLLSNNIANSAVYT